jgi:hypothetical protein
MISESIIDGIISGSGEAIGIAIVTALAGNYYVKNKMSLDVLEVDKNKTSCSTENKVLLKMLEDIGFESKSGCDLATKDVNVIDWKNVRQLNIIINDQEIDSTVGGFINSVWKMLDDKNRLIFLLRALINDTKLNISSNKCMPIIASDQTVDDWLTNSGNRKSIWGFKKSFYGCNIYFLNNYGYENAPELIDIVSNLISDIVSIKVVPSY